MRWAGALLGALMLLTVNAMAAEPETVTYTPDRDRLEQLRDLFPDNDRVLVEVVALYAIVNWSWPEADLFASGEVQRELEPDLGQIHSTVHYKFTPACCPNLVYEKTRDDIRVRVPLGCAPQVPVNPEPPPQVYLTFCGRLFADVDAASGPGVALPGSLEWKDEEGQYVTVQADEVAEPGEEIVVRASTSYEVTVSASFSYQQEGADSSPFTLEAIPGTPVLERGFGIIERPGEADEDLGNPGGDEGDGEGASQPTAPSGGLVLGVVSVATAVLLFRSRSRRH